LTQEVYKARNKKAINRHIVMLDYFAKRESKFGNTLSSGRTRFLEIKYRF